MMYKIKRRIVIALVLCCLSGTILLAQKSGENGAPDIFLENQDRPLADYIWRKRPIVVFADSDANPLFVRQKELLLRRVDELAERDVVVLFDTRPNVKTQLRQKLRPRGFMLVLIGKDGGVKLRKPLPWSVRELSRVIDKMPMRQQEMKK